MKSVKILSFLLVVLSFSAMLCADTVPLPEPQRKGGMALQDALNKRQTVRKYQQTALSRQQISDLVWSAVGVNRDNGKRTIPSAMNRQEVELFVLTAEGGFYYNPQRHALQKRTSADLRRIAGAFDAPLYLVLVVDFGRAASPNYGWLDAGYASQNIYLHCVSAGLGTCAIGKVSRLQVDEAARLSRELQLNKDQKPVLSHSVGIPR